MGTIRLQQYRVSERRLRRRCHLHDVIPFIKRSDLTQEAVNWLTLSLPFELKGPGKPLFTNMEIYPVKPIQVNIISSIDIPLDQDEAWLLYSRLAHQ